jgi:hypothetical protein
MPTAVPLRETSALWGMPGWVNTSPLGSSSGASHLSGCGESSANRLWRKTKHTTGAGLAFAPNELPVRRLHRTGNHIGAD